MHIINFIIVFNFKCNVEHEFLKLNLIQQLLMEFLCHNLNSLYAFNLINNRFFYSLQIINNYIRIILTFVFYFELLNGVMKAPFKSTITQVWLFLKYQDF